MLKQLYPLLGVLCLFLGCVLCAFAYTTVFTKSWLNTAGFLLGIAFFGFGVFLLFKRK